MALKHGSEHYTHWTHMENGKVMPRRIHRMEIQDALGRMHIIEKDNLPEAVLTSTGQANEGKSIARILLRPKSKSYIEWQSLEGPAGVLVWNAFVFGLGFFSALTLRYFARLLIEF